MRHEVALVEHRRQGMRCFHLRGVLPIRGTESSTTPILPGQKDISLPRHPTIPHPRRWIKAQYRWLEAELKAAHAARKLVLVLSHHNRLTLENRAQRPGETERLYGPAELIDLLLRYPVVVAWLNGHTHVNQILAHTTASCGFWEITTASCIDFPQQQQVVELVDNRDGTLSLFTTVLDHASHASPGTATTSTALAARSRELAANDWAETPGMRRGSPLDRNTELLLPAPFDLETITDAALEAKYLGQRARIIAYERERRL